MQFSNSTATAAHFGMSRSTLKLWRNGNADIKPILTEGVHWSKIGHRSILFNIDLLEDFIANRNNPEAHQKAIDAYLSSLPSHAA